LSWVGVHYGICRGSYNTSYLNSPLHHSPLCLPFHLRNSFNRYIFFHLYSCVQSICTIFTLLHPFLTSSPVPLVSTPLQARPVLLPFCSPILQKKGKRNYILACLRWLYREFSCGTFMYICITARFVWFPLYFFFLLYSLCYGSFNQF
jgi:hypothetical protein